MTPLNGVSESEEVYMCVIQMIKTKKKEQGKEMCACVKKEKEKEKRKIHSVIMIMYMHALQRKSCLWPGTDLHNPPKATTAMSIPRWAAHGGRGMAKAMGNAVRLAEANKQIGKSRRRKGERWAIFNFISLCTSPPWGLQDWRD